jgi:substrate-binding family protein
MDAGAEAALALISMPERRTAVVCSNDLTAIGVIRKAFDLSLDIPGDLSVVGFDDIPFAQYMIPPLTTVQIPQRKSQPWRLESCEMRLNLQLAWTSARQARLQPTWWFVLLLPWHPIALETHGDRRLVEPTVKQTDTSETSSLPPELHVAR